MIRNPRKLHQPVRLIVSIEAWAGNAINAYMNARGYHGHCNHSKFARRAIEHGTWNMEHGTWNMEHEIKRRHSDDYAHLYARDFDDFSYTLATPPAIDDICVSLCEGVVEIEHRPI